MTDFYAKSAAGRNKKRLVVVLLMSAAYLVAEVIGGLLTGSLALLADAGHMLTDVAGIGLALIAIQFAERPATPERTYGYYRLEILAAIVNSVILLGVTLVILWEAYRRFVQPQEVSSGAMLIVAVVGLAVNFVSVLMLRRPSGGHAWSLTSGLNACSAHLVIKDHRAQSEVLTQARIILKEEHKLEHSTLELEPPGFEDRKLHE